MLISFAAGSALSSKAPNRRIQKLNKNVAQYILQNEEPSSLFSRSEASSSGELTMRNVKKDGNILDDSYSYSSSPSYSYSYILIACRLNTFFVLVCSLPIPRLLYFRCSPFILITCGILPNISIFHLDHSGDRITIKENVIWFIDFLFVDESYTFGLAR